MKIHLSPHLSLLLVSVCLVWVGVANAGVVEDWNAITAQTIVTGARPGPFGVVDFAMVHASIYDAVQAFDGRFKPYCAGISGATGSPVAAAAAAAHDVLVSLFPAQAASLDTQYSDYLTSAGLLQSDAGVAVGQQAATCIINLRVNDGRFPPNPVAFVGGTTPGMWRPTPSYLPGPPLSFTPGVIPWLGALTPFTLNSPGQFRGTKAPPSLTSKRYTLDYKEVQTLGSFLNSTRTPEQTDLAYFFADNFILLWYRGLRSLALTNVTNIGDSARLFALVSLAVADTAITAWESKYHYVFWRPVTAIQEGDNDDNPRTIGDATWQPLLNTPAYPDYTSGANNLTGAITRMLGLFFGTNKVTFSLTSTHPLVIQNTRTYSRFTDVAQDVVDVRILQGIHFRFADKVGRSQGRHVANWVFRNFLRPIGEDAK